VAGEGTRIETVRRPPRSGVDTRPAEPILGRMPLRLPALRRSLRLALIAPCVLATACAHQRPDPAGARPALDARQAEFFAAMADRDADRLAGLFANDAVLHVANMPPVEGQAAVREFYGNLFGFLIGSRATPGATYMSASGDMAYGTGSTANEFRGLDGAVTYRGKYVLVWRREAGDWRVALYAISSDQPATNR
jgi:ketosteroid isomerase-like protein